MPPVFDQRDAQILRDRTAKLDAVIGPRVGDFIRCADGVYRRICWVHRDPARVQTIGEGAGSYYLGSGYVSYSGALDPSVPLAELELTDERRSGPVWFFHHDWWESGNGVQAEVMFRVYACGRTSKEFR